MINCGGIGLTDMWRVMGLGRLRNRVVVGGGYGVFGRQPLPPDEQRSVTTTVEFLALAGGGSTTGVLPTDLWAETILDALDPPPVLTMLGTIVPVDDEVKQVTTAEFGARWTVRSAGDPDKLVTLIGQRVTIAPGTVEVDVVTEDVTTPDPYVHVGYGTGSGGMSSTSNTYAAARSGTAVALFPQAANPPWATQFFVGQLFGAGPQYEVWESFLAFDTSGIPAGATILEATFAAMFHPRWQGVQPPPLVSSWTHFDIELRSGYAWLPTLAPADWRPGAGIAAAYPLRASVNTARAMKDSFVTFSDAGTGLAAAIVKGGTTQLFLVSARTVAGIAPTSTSLFEDGWFDLPRLRVRYRLP